MENNITNTEISNYIIFNTKDILTRIEIALDNNDIYNATKNIGKIESLIAFYEQILDEDFEETLREEAQIFAWETLRMQANLTYEIERRIEILIHANEEFICSDCLNTIQDLIRIADKYFKDDINTTELKKLYNETTTINKY